MTDPGVTLRLPVPPVPYGSAPPAPFVPPLRPQSLPLPLKSQLAPPAGQRWRPEVHAPVPRQEHDFGMSTDMSALARKMFASYLYTSLLVALL